MKLRLSVVVIKDNNGNKRLLSDVFELPTGSNKEEMSDRINQHVTEVLNRGQGDVVSISHSVFPQE